MSLRNGNTRYWRKNLTLTVTLLLLWLVIAFIPTYFARSLSGFYLFDWPVPYWIAAFGAPFSFLCIIGLYAWIMDRLDRQRRKARKIESSAVKAR